MVHHKIQRWIVWGAAGCGLIAGGAGVELLHRAGGSTLEDAPAAASLELCWDQSESLPLDYRAPERLSPYDTHWPRQLETRNFSTYMPQVAREDQFQLGRDRGSEYRQIDLLFPEQRYAPGRAPSDRESTSFCFSNHPGGWLCIPDR